MSAQSHISVISLAKIGIRDKINQIRLARSMVKHSDSVATTSSETELIEDLPPSYLSTIATQTLSGQDVDETATKETIIEYNDIVITTTTQLSNLAHERAVQNGYCNIRCRKITQCLLFLVSFSASKQ